MARTTTSEVKQLIETDLDPTPFVTSANLVVTRHLASVGLSTEELADVEKWLAAHLIAMADRREKTKSQGSSSVTFDGETGMQLNATMYGQTVKLLDWSGVLSRLGRRQARVQVISEVDVLDD